MEYDVIFTRRRPVNKFHICLVSCKMSGNSKFRKCPNYVRKYKFNVVFLASNIMKFLFILLLLLVLRLQQQQRELLQLEDHGSRHSMGMQRMGSRSGMDGSQHSTLQEQLEQQPLVQQLLELHTSLLGELLG